MFTRRIITAGFALVLVACGDPTAPQPQSGDQTNVTLRSNQNGRCYGVQGDLDEILTLGSGVAGVLSGDLVGTTVGSPPLTDFVAGKSRHFSGGTRSWNITGGIVPELVNSSFTTEFDLVLTGDLPILWANETNRASQGVERANVTVQGTVDVSKFPPTLVADLEYRGTVCP